MLALGGATPVYGWLSGHVSAIGLMRFPIKFVILPVFVLPLLAACALSDKSSAVGSQPAGRAWVWIWLATVALVLGLTAWHWRSAPPDDERKIVLLNGVMRAVFFTAIAVVWVLAGKPLPFKLRRLCQMLFLLLVWLDLFRQMPLPPTVGRAIYRPDLPRRWSAPQLGMARAQIPSAVAGDVRPFVSSRTSRPTIWRGGLRSPMIATCSTTFPSATAFTRST